MSTHEWFYLMAVVGGLLISLPLVRMLAIRTGASAEVSRKTVHVCMGLACLCFPWIFQSPLAVWILAFIASGLLFIMRCIPGLRYGIGCTLHGVNRLSCGEILFAPAIATVFHIAHGEPVYYIIPVAILTVADAAGALAGKRWGRLRYACGDDHKTVEGSLAFLACAIACVFLPLYWLTDLTLLHMIAISIILALLTMIGEGISDRGFDNLILPIGALFILQRLIPLESDALITRLVALAILFFLVLWGSRWSTLNGSSLLGGALLIYGCAILGTWQYALPPIAVFMCHMLTSHTHKLTQRLVHSIKAIIAVTIACLPWLILHVNHLIPTPTGLAGISFAMAALLSILDISTWVFLRSTQPSFLRSTLKGWLIAGLPGLIWLIPHAEKLALPLGISIIATMIAAKLIYLIQGPQPMHQHWLTKGMLALAASLPALLFWP